VLNPEDDEIGAKNKEQIETPVTSSLGAVVLDIGNEVGAAVVYADQSLDGTEIEIRPHGGRWDGTHVAVRSRLSVAGDIHAAVFPGLREGCYEVRRRPEVQGGGVGKFRIVGGIVTELHFGG